MQASRFASFSLSNGFFVDPDLASEEGKRDRSNLEGPERILEKNPGAAASSSLQYS